MEPKTKIEIRTNARKRTVERDLVAELGAVSQNVFGIGIMVSAFMDARK